MKSESQLYLFATPSTIPVMSTEEPRIMTSYFGNVKKLRVEYPNAVLASVARWPPKWCKVDVYCPYMAPSVELIHSQPATPAIGRRRYRAEMNKVKERIIGFLDEMAEQKRDVILLCFESLKNADDWCHRLLLGEIIAKWTGRGVEEA